MVDPIIDRFVKNLALQNEGSAKTVNNYLKDFEEFSLNTLNITVSELVKKLKDGTYSQDPKEEQVYYMFKDYASWLKTNRLDIKDEEEQNSARTVRLKMSWARTMLESNFVQINRTVFKQQIKLPKAEQSDVTPATKDILKTAIEKADNGKMQTYLLFLGSMGWRPQEPLSIRNMDLEGLNLKTLKFQDEEGNPLKEAFVNASGEHAKTRKGKRRRLTTEMARQFEYYLKTKYHPRTIKRYDENHKVVKSRNPRVPQAEDLIFGEYREGKSDKNRSKNTTIHMYKNFANAFAKHVERLGVGWEENGKRHKITLHTFRRYVHRICEKHTSKAYADFHCGRKVHEYDGKPAEEINEEFETVLPFITYLDTSAVEERQESLEQELESQKVEITKLRQKAKQRVSPGELLQIMKENAHLFKDLYKEEVEGKPSIEERDRARVERWKRSKEES